MATDYETIKKLRLSAQIALLGMVYPEIRAIAVGIINVRNVETLKIIYYLDRTPTDSDYESISDVTGQMLCDFDINNVEEVCEYTLESIGKLDLLDCLVYSRL